MRGFGVRTTSTSACARAISRWTARSRHGWACRSPNCRTLKRAFVIGSFLRKDHPLVATRLRTASQGRRQAVGAARRGRRQLLIPTANKFIAAPTDWLAALSEIVSAIAGAKNIAAPCRLRERRKPATSPRRIAAILTAIDGDLPGAVLLGNSVAHHPQASQIHAAAQWIADATGAKFGYLVEAANTVGGHIVGADRQNAASVQRSRRRLMCC